MVRVKYFNGSGVLFVLAEFRTEEMLPKIAHFS